MLKKSFLLFLCTGLSAIEQSEAKKISTTEILISFGVVGITGAGIGLAVATFAPAVIPASIVAIKTAVATAAAKATVAGSAITSGLVAGTPIAGGIGLGLSVATQARPYIFPTKEETRAALLEAEAAELAKAKADFISCLVKNKANIQENILQLPCACHEIALLFEILATKSDFEKMIKELII